MKKTLRTLICSVLLVVMIMSMAACGNNDLQKTLDDLQARLEQQDEKLKQQEGMLGQQDEKLKQQEEALDRQDKKLKRQQKRIKDLEEENKKLQDKIKNLSGKEIEFTADRPIYAKRDNDTKYVEFEHHYDATVSFEGFVDYYRENLKGKFDYDFYFLAPIVSDWDFHPNMCKTYTIYAESIENDLPVNPMVCERLMMYSEMLGNAGWLEEGEETPAGGPAWSVDLIVYLDPSVKILDLRSVHLEFGNNNQHAYWGNKYINLYVNEKCFGTCYYIDHAYISRDWFEVYFRNNLIMA